ITRGESNILYLVNKEGEQRIATAGNVERRFFREFVQDCLNRTENAMTQQWVFTVTELALCAQSLAQQITPAERE
ncbi:gfo/Idh/MocA family oxidoreductase, partial [Candidatus Symbiopectobacterium sp. NZEC135]|nr:gfo/Idh/MocA family oxidoreductase [Candidatus Symbiopectobacterium sp. NZEC135]